MQSTTSGEYIKLDMSFLSTLAWLGVCGEIGGNKESLRGVFSDGPRNLWSLLREQLESKIATIDPFFSASDYFLNSYGEIVSSIKQRKMYFGTFDSAHMKKILPNKKSIDFLVTERYVVNVSLFQLMVMRELAGHIHGDGWTGLRSVFINFEEKSDQFCQNVYGDPLTRSRQLFKDYFDVTESYFAENTPKLNILHDAFLITFSNTPIKEKNRNKFILI